jgi:hypothetical protein
MKFRSGFLRDGGTLTALVLFLAVGAAAETTNTLSDAEIQGRQLAQQLCDARPIENLTNSGVLQIRDGQGNRINFSIKCEAIVTPTNWQNIYVTLATNRYPNGFRLPGLNFDQLQIIHTDNQPTEYNSSWRDLHAVAAEKESEQSASIGVYGGGWGDYSDIQGRDKWSGAEWIHAFSSSDFWAVDLGLEFFHWPAQKVLPKPTNLVRGRDYTLLESTNPNSSTNGYSRVLTWIDRETGGILQAEAYDASGKLLKEFAPKSFKKVNGHWELQEMEIRNVQTGSRTRLEFDLNKQ